MKSVAQSRAKGEGHGMAKLTDEQVVEIRLRFRRFKGQRVAATGRPRTTNAKELAAEFGVTAAHIGALVQGKYR